MCFEYIHKYINIFRSDAEDIKFDLPPLFACLGTCVQSHAELLLKVARRWSVVFFDWER